MENIKMEKRKINGDVYLFEYLDEESDEEDKIVGSPASIKVSDCEVYKCANLERWVRLVNGSKSWMLKVDVFIDIDNLSLDGIVKAVNEMLGGRSIFDDFYL